MKTKDLVRKAFRQINRSNFVSDKDIFYADVDIPLPIGFGQTMSQPTTVRMMLEWLEIKPGEKVLDVGSGSGWTAALLSNIVGDEGAVYAVERIKELKDLGEKNCKKIGIKNTKFYLADEKVFGLPKFAPYNRILVSASADSLPQELIDQLKIGGKMVIPINDSIFEITKKSQDDIEIKEHYGFLFVPLVK